MSFLIFVLQLLLFLTIAALVGGFAASKVPDNPDDQVGSWWIQAIAFVVVFAGVFIGLAGVAWSQSPAENRFEFTIDRVIDADTFEGRARIPVVFGDHTFSFELPATVRLMCINAPESRGKDKSAEGVEMSEHVKALGLKTAWIEPVDRDAFRRYLVYLTPADWSESLNLYLHERGAPLYGRLTKAARAECERRFQ